MMQDVRNDSEAANASNAVGYVGNASGLDVGHSGNATLNGTTVGDMEYIYDRSDVRAIFILLYSIVFSCCFFGNLLVILVVTLSRRLRSITNFFLANLAVADLCVGVFCVYQNLSTYLAKSWVLGDTMCKMYLFVHSLSYTASIFILVVICVERYFAIIHPIRCRQILTSTRLGLVMAGVWLTSAIYSSPRFLFVGTLTTTLDNGDHETMCILRRNRAYNSQLFDTVNFGLLYVAPLCVMCALYSRIAVGLWHSSRDLEAPAELRVTFSTKHRQTGVARTCSFSRHASSAQNVLRARRGVIRMLIAVVLTFALCNLPYHARKMWQYWSSSYDGGSTFSSLLTPLTFLVTYANSGVNPVLYALMSRNFRKGMRELLGCTLRGRGPDQIRGHVSSVGRSSVKSTKASATPTPTA